REPVTFDPGDRGFVYEVARKIVGSPDDAEDVTQDALLLAYRYRDAFRGTSRYRTWLYRIATTTALGHLRRQRRARVRLDGEAELSMIDRAADPAKSPDALIAEAEEHALVRGALAELTPSYRTILLARTTATEVDVAKQLGITVANVKIRAHRARKQLRATLERFEQAAA
ncbi:MAG: sigma-70 family RNA polymerase sigma factor, partial [Deltaproteobacteria bacterium]|nr:sigma-70 family RNA polymerase sigma factor [Deltaproteobacteria bacterium]